MNIKLLFLSISFLILLSACGGGGGGNSNTKSTEATSSTTNGENTGNSTITSELNDNSKVALSMPNVTNDATTPVEELK